MTEAGQDIAMFLPPARRSIRSVRDASNSTGVSTEAMLLPGLGSVSTDVTLAVLPRRASTGGTTTMETPNPVWLVNTPMLQVTTPLVWAHDPRVEFADTKFTPAGNVSVTATPVTIEGPWLVTTSA